MDAHFLLGGASFQFDENNAVINTPSAEFRCRSRFQFAIESSDYVNYNWQTNFNNVKTQELKFEITSKRLFNAT